MDKMHIDGFQDLVQRQLPSVLNRGGEGLSVPVFFFNVLQRFLKCFFFLQARHWIFMVEHLGALANDLGGHSCDRFHQQQGTLRDHVGSDKTGRKCMGPESAVMRPFSFVVNSAGMQRR